MELMGIKIGRLMYPMLSGWPSRYSGALIGNARRCWKLPHENGFWPSPLSGLTLHDHGRARDLDEAENVAPS